MGLHIGQKYISIPFTITTTDKPKLIDFSGLCNPDVRFAPKVLA